MPLETIQNLNDSIQAILHLLKIDITSPNIVDPGQSITAKVVPSLGGLNITDLLDTEIISTLTADIFAMQLDPNEPPKKAGEIQDGKLTTPVQIPMSFPVTIEVEWKVKGFAPQLDIAKSPVISKLGIAGAPSTGPHERILRGERIKISASIADSHLPVPEGATPAVHIPTVELSPGIDFIAPEGLLSPQTLLVMLPAFVEVTKDMEIPVITRLIQARVRLRAGPVDTGWVDLTPAEILLRVIPMPAAAVFFYESGFSRGPVFILVPSNSPLESSLGLLSALDTARPLISSLASISRFASLLTGIDTLSSAIRSASHVAFRKADGIMELSSVTLVDRGFEVWKEEAAQSTNANDTLSSLILVGVSPRKLKCYTRPHFSQNSRGIFTLSLDVYPIALVRTLSTNHPFSEPDANALTVEVAKLGGFQNELSSVQFI